MDVVSEEFSHLAQKTRIKYLVCATQSARGDSQVLDHSAIRTVQRTTRTTLRSARSRRATEEEPVHWWRHLTLRDGASSGIQSAKGDSMPSVAACAMLSAQMACGT